MCIRPGAALLALVAAFVLAHTPPPVPWLRAAGSLGALMARQAEAYNRLCDHRTLGRRYELLPNDLLNFHNDPLAGAFSARQATDARGRTCQRRC